MKDKERLLDRSEPVRFIFSHSALREGWDNPNVFQICTLKQSKSEVRKRQEVGRGLRLCVNIDGERMDMNALGEEVQEVNVLTVVANESYESFSKSLQSEMAQAIGDRPKRVDASLFKEKLFNSVNGVETGIEQDLAEGIYENLVIGGYVKRGVLTPKYYEDKERGAVELDEEFEPYWEGILKLLDSVYQEEQLLPKNARDDNAELVIDESKITKEFLEFWDAMNRKSSYEVQFDPEELIKSATKGLNEELRVSRIMIKIETGEMGRISSREELQEGKAFVQRKKEYREEISYVSEELTYDLIGTLVENTGLNRSAVVRILVGIRDDVFEQFKENPEEFILKASKIINEKKALAMISHIQYAASAEKYDVDMLRRVSARGHLGINAMKAKKHLYNFVIYDSENERKFAEDLEVSDAVKMYIKLPGSYYINTPVGKYHPDWAILFDKNKVKWDFCVAETKGSKSSMQLRPVEDAKIECAKRHYAEIAKYSSKKAVYEVVDGYEELFNRVKKKNQKPQTDL